MVTVYSVRMLPGDCPNREAQCRTNCFVLVHLSDPPKFDCHLSVTQWSAKRAECPASVSNATTSPRSLVSSNQVVTSLWLVKGPPNMQWLPYRQFDIGGPLALCYLIRLSCQKSCSLPARAKGLCLTTPFQKACYHVLL